MCKKTELGIFSATYALDNEQSSYEYRCKLARVILGNLIECPEKSLPESLRAAIDQAPTISTESQKKLYNLMEIVDKYDFPTTDIALDYDIPDQHVIMLLQAVDELYTTWTDDAKRNQIEIEY